MPNTVFGFALMTLGCVLLVAAAVRPQDPFDRPHPNFALAALGDWSYALCPIHLPVIRAMDAMLPRSIPLLAQSSATMAVPIACAVAFGKVDLWLYRVLKRRVDHAGAPVLLGLRGVFLAVMLLFRGGAHWRAIEARRASQKLARIVGTLSEDKSDVATAAELIGLTRNPNLLGHIDNTSFQPPEEQFVQGWAGDASFSARPVDVLIFQCGAFFGAASVREDRPDVATAL
jgi:hypothetical protein